MRSNPTMSTTRTLAAALAIALLGASGAQARPADMPPAQADMHASPAIAADKARPNQDLRPPGARDAGQRVREPAQVAVPDPPRAIAPAAKTAPSGVDWLPIALGSGLTLVVMFGLVALNS